MRGPGPGADAEPGRQRRIRGRVRIVDARRNQERFFSVFTNKRPYAHTKVRWSRAKAKPQGCFQLESRRYEDGKYGEIKPNYNNPYRLLSQEALEQIYALFAALPYPMVHIGQHLGLAGSIKVASESRFFIGIDSGMSHLCHSIGVPVYLYEGRPTELTVHDLHPGKAFKTFANIEDVAAILKRHT